MSFSVDVEKQLLEENANSNEKSAVILHSDVTSSSNNNNNRKVLSKISKLSNFILCSVVLLFVGCVIYETANQKSLVSSVLEINSNDEIIKFSGCRDKTRIIEQINVKRNLGSRYEEAVNVVEKAAVKVVAKVAPINAVYNDDTYAI